MSLIELGSSAGLQLIWDHYAYSYGDELVYGNCGSPVRLTSKVHSDHFPVLLESSPPIAARIGLDLHINDLTNHADYLWLKALIWPEHQERLLAFEQAAGQLAENPVRLIEGDGVSMIGEAAEQVPADSLLCIFHTHVANQMPASVKRKLEERIQGIGRKRNVIHIYNNMWDSLLHVDAYINGQETSQIIGRTDGHGHWFEWRLPAESTISTKVPEDGTKQ